MARKKRIRRGDKYSGQLKRDIDRLLAEVAVKTRNARAHAKRRIVYRRRRI